LGKAPLKGLKYMKLQARLERTKRRRGRKRFWAGTSSEDVRERSRGTLWVKKKGGRLRRLEAALKGSPRTKTGREKIEQDLATKTQREKREGASLRRFRKEGTGKNSATFWGGIKLITRNQKKKTWIGSKTRGSLLK